MEAFREGNLEVELSLLVLITGYPLGYGSMVDGGGRRVVSSTGYRHLRLGQQHGLVNELMER